MPDNPKGLELKEPSLEKFRKLISAQTKPWAIVMAQVDPDGIATAKLIKAAIEHAGGEVAGIYYGGKIDHPQNQAIVTHFDLKEEMRPVEEMPKEGPVALADCSKLQDDRIGRGFDGTRVELVIDHHQDNQVNGRNGKDRWCWIPQCGAAATPAWMLAKALGAPVDEKLATAVALGIYADTQKLRSTRTLAEDHKAFGEAIAAGDQGLFAKCSAYLLPKRFRKLLAETMTHCVELGTYRLAHPVSLMHEDEGSYLAIIADEMHRYEGTRITIVWALVGRLIRVCVRSSNPEVDMNELIDELFGKGSGGGKHNASGGAVIELPQLLAPSESTAELLVTYIEAQTLSKIEKKVGPRHKEPAEDDED